MLQVFAILVILVAILLFFLQYSVRGGRKGELINKIPGPYAWPIIGNIGIYMVPLEELWKISRSMNEEYYPIHRIWSVVVPVVNVQHPDDVEAVLSSIKHIEKSRLYDFLHPWLKTGLLTSTGAKWHERRKILTPAFHFDVLRQFVGIFIEQSDKIVEGLSLEGEEVVKDLVPLLHKYTLNSICETAMGATSNVDEKVLSEYRSCVCEMGDIMLNRLLRPWLHPDWLFKFSRKFQEQCKALKVLHGFSTGIINERKQYLKDTDGQDLKELESNKVSSIDSLGDEKHVKGKRRLAMLDLLISASNRGANIDDEGIREEVDTFIFEGHDTTAMALTFAIMLLAENKDAQNKARAEIDEVFEESDGKLSYKGINSLNYLERCIKESLRLFPSVPFISRHVSKDIQLKKYLVPGGTIVHVHIYDLHRDPNFWPNPDIFDPDRFLPDRMQGRHPFAYVPFSAGPRNCIGQRFAMLELKAILANFLHNFYLEPIDSTSEVRIIPDLVLRTTSPTRVKFVRRSHYN